MTLQTGNATVLHLNAQQQPIALAVRSCQAPRAEPCCVAAFKILLRQVPARRCPPHASGGHTTRDTMSDDETSYQIYKCSPGCSARSPTEKRVFETRPGPAILYQAVKSTYHITTNITLHKGMLA